MPQVNEYPSRSFEFTVTTPPGVEPVSWDDLKAHSRIDDDTEKTIGETYITAARIFLEDFSRRTFVTTAYELQLRGFPIPNGQIALPRAAPLGAVTGITYKDTDGSSQSFSDFQINTKRQPGLVAPDPGVTWPATQVDVYDAVTIDYAAGYGNQATSVPDPIRVAILHLSAHWFEHREPILAGTTGMELPHHLKSLMWNIRAEVEFV